MKKNIRFWEFISQYKIEIPIIQRDYAQGREEARITTLRENFISDLTEQLSTTETPNLHLGFVYGKLEGKDKAFTIRKNKEAISNILNAVKGYAEILELNFNYSLSDNLDQNKNFNIPNFIPLDGQQRLTTLYLLHWYLNLFLVGDNFVRNLEILSRFTYKTRKSSLAFCTAICNKKNRIGSDKINNSTSVSELITNSTWFLDIWLKDITVKGMLVMLDEIHKQLRDREKKEELFDYLKSTSNIYFDFLDLDELNQTDELYVKMNARGKQLTDFEHFKAWLQKYITKENIIIENENWETDIDKTWLDLFWQKNEKTYDIDSLFYSAFKQISLLAYISSTDTVNNSLVNAVREENYISFKTFEKGSFFTSETLNFLFTTLGSFSHKKEIENYEVWLNQIARKPFLKEDYKLSDYFISKKQSIELPEMVFYYAFILFINDSTINNNEIQFKRWMRVCRNLIFNTYIQNPKNFIDAIKSIKKLAEYKNDIYSYIQDEETSIDFFFTRQQEQEIEKSILIEQSKEWKETIIQIENHPYFQADIKFILDLSKQNGVYDYNTFVKYSDILSELYKSKIRNHKNKLLERALLTKGDYMPQVGGNFTFCLPTSGSLRARRDNWQRFFYSDKINLLKDLILSLIDTEDIENKLNEILTPPTRVDWAKYVIDCPETITYCNQGFVRFDDNDNASLLRTTRIYGKHAELRTYNFYIKNEIEKNDFSPFEKVFYWENRMGRYDYSCVRFTDFEFNKVRYKLELYFDLNIEKYKLVFLQEDGEELNDDIFEYFEGWKNKNTKFIKSFEEQDNILKEINTIVSKLKLWTK